MTFNLEEARQIANDMMNCEWLRYEDEFGMQTLFPEAITEIEILRLQLDAARRLIKEQDDRIKEFESW